MIGFQYISDAYTDHELNCQERALYNCTVPASFRNLARPSKTRWNPEMPCTHTTRPLLAQIPVPVSLLAALPPPLILPLVTIGTRNQAGIMIGSDGAAVSERRTAEHKMSAVGSAADDGGVGTL
jgi:hypothetical protein